MSRKNLQHIQLKKNPNSDTNSDAIKNIPEHVNYVAGIPPYLRGPYATMYIEKPWTIRQYSGFSTAKESNQFFKKNLKAGQKGLSVAFDLPTHRGYDSDHDRVIGDVGKAGVAIDTVDDMKILFKDLSLDKLSVSMTMNGAILPIMAFFIVAAEEQGVSKEQLTGTIQNDILKEYIVRNTYIYPPKPSMQIVAEIFKYTNKHMPKFKSISISGYHMHEAGATAATELAYTMANGLEYIKIAIKAGIEIDQLAPNLSFFWAIGMNHFTEIAKMRAARMLWAKIVKQFNPKNAVSMRLKTHCQTSGWSLTEQDPFNNVARTTIEATAAIFGGTQSLHTNALDEAIALPTDFSARIARNTQLFLQEETKITKTIDPWAGSYLVENLTDEIANKAWGIIQEIENYGGMTKAIEAGIPKQKIEEEAAKKQARIDSNKDIILGVNKYQLKTEAPLSILEVDNTIVREQQIKALNNIKKQRDSKAVAMALTNITNAAKQLAKNNYTETNLLALSIEAAKNRATLGEISNALEIVFKRHKGNTQLISGIYSNEIEDDTAFKKAKELAAYYAQQLGKKPKIMIAKIGQDGHDRGAKVVASGYKDIGFEVVIGSLFQTPKEIAAQAIANNVIILGISSLAGGHKTLALKTIQELKNSGRNDIKIVIGGIIPKQDHEKLYDAGVVGIYGPGTKISDAAIEILQIISD